MTPDREEPDERESGQREPAEQKPTAAKGPIRRFFKWPLRIALIFVGMVLLFFLSAVVLGLLTTNSSWKQSPQGKRVYVITNGVHTSFILPTGKGEDSLLHLVPFEGASPADCPYVEFGWGDRYFYLETPAWSDLKLTTALHAMLLPSSTVVHVDYWYREPQPDEDIRRIRLAPDEYRRLLDYIRQSFALDTSHHTQRIPGAHYGSRDAFFEGAGTYHLFHTCNDWTNTGLKAAGVKTAIWSPFDKAILYHLPRATPR